MLACRQVKGLAVVAFFLVIMMVSGTALAKVTLRFRTDREPFGQWIVEEFNKTHPEIEVVFEGATEPGKFVTESAAGVAPDVLGDLYMTWAWNAAGDGLFLDLTPYVERDQDEVDIEDFLPLTIQQYTQEGRLFGIPTWQAVSGLFYNTALFDAAGVPYIDDSWDWNTLVEQGKKLVVRNADGESTQWAFTPDGWSFSWSTGPTIWVWSNGGRIVSDDKQKFLLDEYPAREALNFFRDMIFEHEIAYPQTMQSVKPWWDRFTDQEIAIWDCPSWSMRMAYGDLPVKIAPTIPSPNTGQASAFIHIRAMGISSTTKHPDEAWEFVKFATSAMAARGRIGKTFTYSLPTRSSVMPDFLDYEHPSGKRVDLGPFLVNIERARLLPILDDPKANSMFWSTLDGEWKAVMNGTKPVETFLATVEERAKGILSGELLE